MSKLDDEEKQDLTLNEKMYLHSVKSNSHFRYWIIAVYLIAILAFSLPIFVEDAILSLDVIFWSLLVVFTIGMILHKIDNRILYRLIRKYVNQNYYLVFQTTKPEGRDWLEKFMSLAQDVFPSVKEALRKLSKEGKDWRESFTENKQLGFIELKTSDGKLLIKKFSKTVKFEDIEELVHNTKKLHKKRSILRMVCIAEKYDQAFFAEDFDKKMQELIPETVKFKTLLSSGQAKKWIYLDFILERENGFTIIWLGA